MERHPFITMVLVYSPFSYISPLTLFVALHQFLSSCYHHVMIPMSSTQSGLQVMKVGKGEQWYRISTLYQQILNLQCQNCYQEVINWITAFLSLIMCVIFRLIFSNVALFPGISQYFVSTR